MSEGLRPRSQLVVGCRQACACLVEPQLREASVSSERTFVGLDVHARSVAGHALDAVTGEVWQRRLTPDPADV